MYFIDIKWLKMKLGGYIPTLIAHSCKIRKTDTLSKKFRATVKVHLIDIKNGYNEISRLHNFIFKRDMIVVNNPLSHTLAKYKKKKI